MSNKFKVLFLDDMGERHERFDRLYGNILDIKHVFNYDECVKALSEERFQCVYLDHDLCIEDILCEEGQFKEKNGTDVANWIASNLEPFMVPEIVVHSLNPAGAERMVMILNSAGFDAMSYPFINMVSKVY